MEGLGRRLLSNLLPVVRKLDSAIHRIKLYPVDNAVHFAITYPWDSVIRPLYNWALVNIESGVASGVKSSWESEKSERSIFLTTLIMTLPKLDTLF